MAHKGHQQISLESPGPTTRVRDPWTQHRSSVFFEQNLGVSHLTGAKQWPWVRLKDASKATESTGKGIGFIPMGPRLPSA